MTSPSIPDAAASLTEFVMRNDVMVLGMTGVGKTTLVNHLQRLAPLRYVSLGDIVRALESFSEDAELTDLVAAGGVWPFEKVRSIVEPFMDIPTPYVLDGVPKHEHEAEWVASRSGRRRWPLHIISLEAEVGTIRRRLASASRGHRNETVRDVEHRIETFSEKHDRILEVLAPVSAAQITLRTDDLTPDEVVDTLILQLVEFGRRTDG
jgi:adenylate kinase family enzyme